MRLGGRIGIAAVTTHLPPTSVSVAEAIAAGRTDARDAQKVGLECLPVAGDETSGPQMAVQAAERALAAAGWSAGDLDLLLHAWIHHQGHDFWSPAHYVADRLGAVRALPMGLQQMCNGGGVGLEVACARLLADPDTSRVLITTGDRFADQGFDRWRGDYGVWYGDGATACLLHRLADDRTPATRLLAVRTRAVAEVEGLHRGLDAFSPAARWAGPVVDVRRTKKGFIETVGLEGFYARSREALQGVVLDALADAGVDAHDPRLRLIAVPRVGRSVVAETYEPALEGVTKAEVVHLGERTGHLGAGDLAANLARVHAERLIGDGEMAIFVSAGGGFSFTCALVGLGPQEVP